MARFAFLGALAASIATLGMGLISPRPAEAHSPYLVVPEAAEAEATAAYRYANMTNEEALAELDRRKIPYVAAEPIAGVRAPVRLTGRLHGVSIHSTWPIEERASSVYEVLDARLALMLDDFCVLLERHDIDEIVHYSLYRPNVPKEREKPVVDPILPKAQKAKTTPSEKIAEKPEKNVEKNVEKRESPKAPSNKLPETTKELSKPEPKAKESKKIAPKGQKSKSSLGTDSGKKQEMVLGPSTSPASPAKPTRIAKVAKKAVEPHRVRAKAPITEKNAQSEPKAPIAAKTVAPRAEPKPIAKPTRKWAPPGTRHPAGLAIDVGLLHKKDGTWLSIASAFQGKIGAQTCGQGVPWPADEAARELRAIVCEAAEQGIFTYILTPNYDQAHADHLHMEIKPGVRWFLVH